MNDTKNLPPAVRAGLRHENDKIVLVEIKKHGMVGHTFSTEKEMTINTCTLYKNSSFYTSKYMYYN